MEIDPRLERGFSRRWPEMIRMGRWLINLLGLISALLLAITVTLGFRSIWVRDSWLQHTSEMVIVNEVESNRGSLWIFYGNPQLLFNRGVTEVKWEWSRGRSGPQTFHDPHPILGTGYRRLAGGGAILLIPYWLIAVITGALPVWMLVAKQRRRGPGLCRKCGYDLRGSSSNCPECGTEIQESVKDGLSSGSGN